MTTNQTHLKTIALVGVLALAALVPAVGAAEAKYLVVLDTPDGIVQHTVTQSELDATTRCNANAPSVPSCVNGPVPMIGFASHGLALPIPSGFTVGGVGAPVHKEIFTSFLRSPTTERIFRCEINEGQAPTAFSCFPGSGSFPPVGSQMTQTAIGFAATTGGSGDTTALTVYQQSGGQVLLPGVGAFTAQLLN